jgi:branched-chain amino acid transport system permease protein
VTTFLQLVVVGLSTGSAFAVVGISFVLIFRTTGIVNFAQGAFAVLGGLFTVALGHELPRAGAAVAAIALTALIGTAMAVIAVGFRGRTTPLASLIVTIGLALLTSSIVLLGFGDRPHTYPAISAHAWDAGGVLIQPQYVLIAAVTFAAAVLLTWVLRHTIVGQALVACSDSRRAAELVGLDVRSIAVIAFAVSAALSAVGGLLLTPLVPMNYDSDVNIAVNGFAAASFGGLGSIRLALLGGYVLGIAEQLVVGYYESQYQLAIALVIMLVLIGWRSRHELAV